MLARGYSGSCEIQQDTAGWQFGVREHLFNYDVIVKATMLPSSIAKLVRDVIGLGGSAVAQATGTMLAGFRERVAATAVPELYEYVDRARGEMVVLQAGRALPPWVLPTRRKEGALGLMREVKRQFDAKRTLNPGRFLGGI